MTRGTMRTALRRMLNEPVADQWDDAALNEFLAHGVLMIEKEILKTSPQEFAKWATDDLEANKDAYPLPTDFIRELRIELKDAAGDYQPQPCFEYDSLMDDEPNGYAIMGRFIHLRPTPTAAVVDGLRLVYVPVLTMAEDSDTPAIPDFLHIAAVLWAKTLANEETGEQVEATKARITEMVLDLPLWMRPGRPGRIIVEGL